MEKEKRLKIGLDFDGVVAFSPFNVIRAPIKWFKAKVLKKNDVSFFVPKNSLHKFIWLIIHEFSVLPANGVSLLKELSKDNNVEFHLITARFGYLEKNLLRWLAKNNLLYIFKSVNVNHKEEQPHKFKKRMVEKLKLDAYIEDNLDIAEFLNKETNIPISWIYNVVDRNKFFNSKFKNLKEALEEIVK